MPDTEYITQADIQALLGAFVIPSAWTAGSPSPLTTAITRVRKVIDSFCGTTFAPVHRTFILNGTGQNALLFAPVTTYPICTLTEVLLRLDPTVDFDASNVLALNVDYYIHDSRAAIVRLTNANYGRGNYYDQRESDNSRFDVLARDRALPYAPHWPRIPRSVKVTGTFGRNGIPEMVKKAAVLLVREELQPGYIADFSDDFYSETFPDGYSKVAASSRPSADGGSMSATGSTGYTLIDRLLIPHRRGGIGIGVV